MYRLRRLPHTHHTRDLKLGAWNSKPSACKVAAVDLGCNQYEEILLGDPQPLYI